MNAAGTISGMAETRSAKWPRDLPALAALDWLRGLGGGQKLTRKGGLA